ncbi:MAG: hypothetical protein HY860_00375 [Chlamydiales bacterium]|nr:hypothetical protein [Chlamydiales bacterium]
MNNANILDELKKNYILKEGFDDDDDDDDEEDSDDWNKPLNLLFHRDYALIKQPQHKKKICLNNHVLYPPQ